MNWKKHSLHLLWIVLLIVVDVFIVQWLEELRVGRSPGSWATAESG